MEVEKFQATEMTQISDKNQLAKLILIPGHVTQGWCMKFWDLSTQMQFLGLESSPQFPSCDVKNKMKKPQKHFCMSPLHEYKKTDMA